MTLGFVNFDDPQYVWTLHVRAGLTWNGIAWAATETYAGNWHPVTWVSHMADTQLYGVNPRGHHATSAAPPPAEHGSTVRRPRPHDGAPLRSALVAGLFGVHPLQVESVAWVAERKDVLSATFISPYGRTLHV